MQSGPFPKTHLLENKCYLNLPEASIVAPDYSVEKEEETFLSLLTAPLYFLAVQQQHEAPPSRCQWSFTLCCSHILTPFPKTHILTVCLSERMPAQHCRGTRCRAAGCDHRLYCDPWLRRKNDVFTVPPLKRCRRQNICSASHFPHPIARPLDTVRESIHF